MTIDLASVFDASSGGLSFFLIPLALFGLPILAYQIDPKRPIVFFQDTQKVVWFKAEPQSLWRLNQKGFDLVDHMGNRFGRINPRKGQVYDLDDRLMIETQVSMSDGKKLAAFIEIISLLSGGIRSTEGIGTDNKTYLSGKTPNKPIGRLRRSNALTGTCELTIEPKSNIDLKFVFALAILGLES